MPAPVTRPCHQFSALAAVFASLVASASHKKGIYNAEDPNHPYNAGQIEHHPVLCVPNIQIVVEQAGNERHSELSVGSLLMRSTEGLTCSDGKLAHA